MKKPTEEPAEEEWSAKPASRIRNRDQSVCSSTLSTNLKLNKMDDKVSETRMMVMVGLAVTIFFLVSIFVLNIISIEISKDMKTSSDGKMVDATSGTMLKVAPSIEPVKPAQTRLLSEPYFMSMSEVAYNRNDFRTNHAVTGHEVMKCPVESSNCCNVDGNAYLLYTAVPNRIFAVVQGFDVSGVPNRVSTHLCADQAFLQAAEAYPVQLEADMRRRGLLAHDNGRAHRCIDPISQRPIPCDANSFEEAVEFHQASADKYSRYCQARASGAVGITDRCSADSLRGEYSNDIIDLRAELSNLPLGFTCAYCMACAKRSDRHLLPGSDHPCRVHFDTYMTPADDDNDVGVSEKAYLAPTAAPIYVEVKTAPAQGTLVMAPTGDVVMGGVFSEEDLDQFVDTPLEAAAEEFGEEAPKPAAATPTKAAPAPTKAPKPAMVTPAPTEEPSGGGGGSGPGMFIGIGVAGALLVGAAVAGYMYYVKQGDAIAKSTGPEARRLSNAGREDDASDDGNSNDGEPPSGFYSAPAPAAQLSAASLDVDPAAREVANPAANPLFEDTPQLAVDVADDDVVENPAHKAKKMESKKKAPAKKKAVPKKKKQDTESEDSSDSDTSSGSSDEE